MKKIIVSRNSVFNKRLFPFLHEESETDPPFDMNDVFTFPVFESCAHVIPETDQSMSQSPKQFKSSNNNVGFHNARLDTDTFCRSCDTLSKQFPQYLLSPTIMPNDKSHLQRQASIISDSTRDVSPLPSPPASPCMTISNHDNKSQKQLESISQSQVQHTCQKRK